MVNEDEYFARDDVEKLRRLHKERMKRLSAAQKEDLRREHHGRCPGCGLEMQPLPKYEGIKVLRCFGCNGVFLSDGDLESLQKKVLKTHEHKVVNAILNWIRQDAA